MTQKSKPDRLIWSIDGDAVSLLFFGVDRLASYLVVKLQLPLVPTTRFEPEIAVPLSEVGGSEKRLNDGS